MPWDACATGGGTYAPARWGGPAGPLCVRLPWRGAVIDPASTAAAFWFRGRGYVDRRPVHVWTTVHGRVWGLFAAEGAGVGAVAVRAAAAGAGAWDPSDAAARVVAPGVVEVPWRPDGAVPAEPIDWAEFAACIPAHFAVDGTNVWNALPAATQRGADGVLRGRFAVDVSRTRPR